ncbi:ABC-2 type transport system permease protein [Kribbella voronezhensis]|uniref:ABC-2 type transport system permease protein n=1 Tax=Kribbella voronezhensis TaxID=2512212 RepID=A0A4R7SX38_9ACTN|nr:ABC-2 family transporter protein [Kribbella voronezhensis]TDU83216.1 ABC-2 type transport system permease protein [Kribbella voronezhensis]
MRTVRLFGTAFSLALRGALAYRTNLFFDALLALVQLAASIATIGIVFTRTGLLAGWSAGQMLVLVGTYSLITGLRATFLDPSLADFSEQIRDGRLDAYLLRPANSVLLATTTRHAPVAVVQCILGVGVIISGLRELETIPSPAALAAWFLLTCAGLLIGWATSVGLASLAFWAPRLNLGVLHGAAWEFGRYPIDIYGRCIRQLLTFAFPVAVVTTWPARILVHGPDLGTLLMAVLLAAGFTAGTLLLWRLGLRRYTGATS